MDCQKLQELLASREDAGTLPEVVRHAAQCSKCQHLLHAEARINSGFSVLAKVPLKTDLAGPVLRKIRDSGAGKASPGTAPIPAPVSSSIPLFVATGALILGVLGMLSLFIFSGGRQANRPAPERGEGKPVSQHPTTTHVDLPPSASGAVFQPNSHSSVNHRPSPQASQSQASSHPPLQPVSTASAAPTVAAPVQPPANE